MLQLQSAFGIVALLAIAWALGENRRAVSLRQAAIGLHIGSWWSVSCYRREIRLAIKIRTRTGWLGVFWRFNEAICFSACRPDLSGMGWGDAVCGVGSGGSEDGGEACCAEGLTGQPVEQQSE